MRFKVGDTVRVRNDHVHMEVTRIVSLEIVECEYYDEQGKHPHSIFRSDGLEFIADVPTEELLEARRAWMSAKVNFVKTNETLRKERERRKVFTNPKSK